MYNFADDNFLPTIAKTVVELKNTLQSELEVVINWLKNNKMVVNNNQWTITGKVTIMLDKREHHYSNETIKFDKKTIETVSYVRLLGAQLDDKLNSSLHVSNIYKFPANQLSALIRLNNVLCFERKWIDS